LRQPIKHDFRPDYSRIAEIRNILGNPTMIALTATAQCRQDIHRQMGIDKSEIELFHEGIDRQRDVLECRNARSDLDRLSQPRSKH